jgi:hypothetical protein
MPNVWMEMLMGRLRDWFGEALEKSEYFDFMTLLRRILNHPELMDFDFIIANGEDKAVELSDHEDIVTAASYMGMKAARIAASFATISNTTTLDEIRSSNYVLHPDDNRYSFMEFYWIYLTWLCFGDEDTVEAKNLAGAIKTYREQLDDEHGPNDCLVRFLGMNDLDDDVNHPEQVADLMQVLLMKIDRSLAGWREAEHKASDTDEVRCYLH